ncbi:MAG: hypothetical protein AAB772_01005 [Patescibacteria group bacterium]
MPQKKIKKELSSAERGFGVILEDIDSKLDLVVEGHQVLDKKIDGVDAKVDNLQKEMNYKFDVVFEKFGEIDQRFEQVDQRFEQIDQQFSEVKDELHLIRNDLKEKVSRDEFVLLEKRVAILERSKK